MNGLDLLHAMKHDERWRSIPVVVLTTSDKSLDIFESYDYSIAGYRPFCKTAQDRDIRDHINRPQETLLADRVYQIQCDSRTDSAVNNGPDSPGLARAYHGIGPPFAGPIHTFIGLICLSGLSVGL